MAAAEVQKQQAEIPDDLKIRQQVDYVEHIKDRLAMAERELRKMIAEFQETCEHDWREVIAPNPNFYGAEALANGRILGARCSKCKLFQPC